MDSIAETRAYVVGSISELEEPLQVELKKMFHQFSSLVTVDNVENVDKAIEKAFHYEMWRPAFAMSEIIKQFFIQLGAKKPTKFQVGEMMIDHKDLILSTQNIISNKQ